MDLRKNLFEWWRNNRQNWAGTDQNFTIIVVSIQLKKVVSIQTEKGTVADEPSSGCCQGYWSSHWQVGGYEYLSGEHF